MKGISAALPRVFQWGYGARGVQEFKRISAGIQNFNFFPLGADGNPLFFFSIMRFGQGEIQDLAHQKQIFAAQADLAKASVLMPVPIPSRRGEILEIVPNEIDGVKMPSEIAGKPMVLYTLLHGRAADVKKATLGDFKQMGRMHGKFLAEGQKLADKYSDMRNPVSFAALQNMMKAAMGYSDEVSLESILVDRVKLAEQQAKVIETLNGRIEKELQKENPNTNSIELVKTFVRSLKNGWYEQTLEKFIEAKNIWQERGFYKIPMEILHNDMHFGNVFLPDGENKGGIFDMGWMGRGQSFLDFCQPCVLNARDSDGSYSPEKARAYFQGMQENRQLTELEKENFAVMQWMTFFRSTPTRLMSIVNSEVSEVKKSPVELTGLQDRFKRNFMDKSDWVGYVTQRGESKTELFT